MKEKLKALNIRITELAQYLNISRPTLYKNIEDYEQKRFKDIKKRVRSVFDFINKKNTLSKIAVIDFIIKDVGEIDKNLNELFQNIINDKSLSNLIKKDLKNNGLNGVIKKIKHIYEGDVK